MRPQIAENPFASRFVRPGAVPFYFSGGEELRQLVGRLESCGWHGAIIGPHGSGKSTLLTHLATDLREVLRDVEWFPFPESNRSRLALKSASDRLGSILVIDGFDGLPAWRRRLVRLHCWRRRQGLVVTTHRPVGLPVLFMTSTSPRLGVQIAARLAGAKYATQIEPFIRYSLARHHGNMREVLFDLYDLYEQSIRQQRTEHGTTLGRD